MEWDVSNKIQQLGGRAEAIVCDVSDIASVRNLVNQVINKHGRIDILVNNAGVVVFKAIEELTKVLQLLRKCSKALTQQSLGVFWGEGNCWCGIT